MLERAESLRSRDYLYFIFETDLYERLLVRLSPAKRTYFVVLIFYKTLNFEFFVSLL